MHTSFGAQGSRSSSRVRVVFKSAPASEVQVVDRGEKRDYVMYNNRGTEETKTRWKTTWPELQVIPW